MPNDKERLDWLEKALDTAEGQVRDARSDTGWITKYLIWGKRGGASGNIRAVIDREMAASGVSGTSVSASDEAQP